MRGVLIEIDTIYKTFRKKYFTGQQKKQQFWIDLNIWAKEIVSESRSRHQTDIRLGISRRIKWRPLTNGRRKKESGGKGRENKNQVLLQKGKWGRVLSVSIPQYLGYLESMKKCLTGHRQVPEEAEMVVAPDMNHWEPWGPRD